MTRLIPPREILSNPPPGLKYISICSGIEAATVAFHPLGWQPLAFAEIEAFPSAVLAHHYPAIPNLGDMTNYHDWPEDILAECDLLVGGPPCQAFSMAGQRRSLDDERGNLTLTYVNLINHIDTIRRKHGRDPIIALYENVPGIYSTRDNAFGCLVGAICGQDAPVETETGKWPTAGIFWGEKRRVGYRTLDAQYFGLAQRRRRCFLLAVPNELVEHAGNRACPSEILSIPESLRGDSPPSREKGESPTFDVAPSLTSSGRGVERTGESRGQDPVIPCWWDGGQISQTLDAVLSKGQAMPEKNRFPAVLQPITIPINMQAATKNGKKSPNMMGVGNDGDPAPTLGANDVHAVAFTCKDYGADVGETAPTLRAMGHSESHANAGGQLAVAFAQNTRDEVREMPYVGALAAEPGMKQTSYIRQVLKVRRITPEECEKLQGFPVGYTNVPYRGKPAADGNRYKALGNSFAVPVVRWIGWRIQMMDGILCKSREAA